MKGLALSEEYFFEIGWPMIRRYFPTLSNQMAFGLAGAGSECAGYDDEISKDHDWGAGFYIWVPRAVYTEYYREIQAVYNSLPKKYKGFPVREKMTDGTSRAGVFEIQQFFYQYIGNEGVPPEPIRWFYASETAYHTVTSGKIFKDNLGEFRSIFQTLANGYPEDVRRKKIAARVFTMAQAGQYNYLRCIRRGDRIGAGLAMNEFMKATISVVHLLNNHYTPFYKWAGKSLREQPILGQVSPIIETLCGSPCENRAVEKIEEICEMVKRELAIQNMSSCKEDYLLNHANAIMDTIVDEQIRSLPVQYG